MRIVKYEAPPCLKEIFQSVVKAFHNLLSEPAFFRNFNSNHNVSIQPQCNFRVAMYVILDSLQTMLKCISLRNL